MELRSQSISSVAGRVGLYHFAVVAAAGLLDGILSPRRCIPSLTSTLVRLVELPGIRLLRCFPSSIDLEWLSAPLAVAGFLRIVVANSLLYGALVALVLVAMRTLEARSPERREPRRPSC